jgi:urea carboxylase
MDDWAFRTANRILENPESSAAIEATIIGPTLRFHTDTYISLTGAPTDATLDGKRVLFWKPIHVQAGQTLRVGKIISGCRTYLAVRNGFNVPEYLGSKSTFTPGQFGGHAGRTLRGSDMLLINRENGHYEPINVPETLVPIYGEEWDIGCLLGPHGAPDFITEKSFESFFKVSYTNLFFLIYIYEQNLFPQFSNSC